MRSRSFRVGPANDDELLAVEPFGLAPPSTPVPSWLVVGLGGEPCRHVTLGFLETVLPRRIAKANSLRALT